MEAVEEIGLQVSIRRDEPNRRLGGEGRQRGHRGVRDRASRDERRLAQPKE